jgi:hypothetical protein
MVFPANEAQAVPSYARQMNMECGGCHTRFPKLNAFGREFKLTGYTLQAGEQIRAENDKKTATLSLNQLPPISVMLQAAYTHTASSVPDTQNSDVQLPQQLSLFLAGRISPKLGSFLQLTYTQEDDKFSIDNTDIRFADRTTVGGMPVAYGLTLNNAPTVEDLWNSTPTWGFPWAGPDASPGPAAATLIDGGLSQDVVGIGAYSLWNQSFYVAGTLYRSAHLGSTTPSVDSINTIDSVAPYLRLAWQHQWASSYLEVGVYGIRADLIPEGVSGSTDRYQDIAADFQFERLLRGGQLTVHGTYIHEKQELDASFAAGNSANASNDLDTARLDASYGVDNWEIALGLFSTTGDSDAGLYGPGEVDGSANFEPDSRGWVGQLAYFPWQNVQLLLQYTGYNKFNGRRSDYDGFGRNASDNNALFLQAWFMW